MSNETKRDIFEEFADECAGLNDEIYIAMYCTGSYEDYNEEIIGISSTRKVAESYATRLADELNEEARKTGWLEPGSIQIRELDGEKYKPEENTVVMYRRDYKKRRMLKDE